MDILIPDPHPGRCQNFRYDGRIKTTKRCLDYDGHDGACLFPEPGLPPMTVQTSQVATYQPRPPEPWVSPLDAHR